MCDVIAVCADVIEVIDRFVVCVEKLDRVALCQCYMLRNESSHVQCVTYFVEKLRAFIKYLNCAFSFKLPKGLCSHSELPSVD